MLGSGWRGERDEKMSVYDSADRIFRSFGQDYKAFGTYRYKVVDDSVILICGCRSYRGLLFDVYYACVPVFSSFDLNRGFLNEATGFNTEWEFKYKPDKYLLINPESLGEKEEEIIEKASVLADYAHEKLETIKTLDDCLGFYEQVLDERIRNHIASSPMRDHIDILIFRREFEECKALLERALLNNVHWTFNYNKTEFPEDGNWRKYLPDSYEDAENPFQKMLFSTENSCWKKVRTPLAEGKYYEFCSELMQLYKANKRKLKKIGIQLGEKADAMMEEMMLDVEKKH